MRLIYIFILAIFAAAGLLLAPGPTAAVAGLPIPLLDVAGVVLLGVIWRANRPRS